MAYNRIWQFIGLTILTTAPVLGQQGNVYVDPRKPLGELVCNKGRWAKSIESEAGAILAEGLINAFSKRVCYGHIATAEEIDQVLSHPIFNQGRGFFKSVSGSQKEAAEVQVSKELRATLQGASIDQKRRLFAMFPSIKQRAVDQAGQNFPITYSDLDAFTRAQPTYRSTTRFLPSDLRDDVIRYGDQIFTRAYRARVFKLGQLNKESALGFLTSSSIVLGKDILGCVKKSETVSSTVIDRSGLPQNIESQRDTTSNSCFSLIVDRTFINLISVREWHPFLWMKLSQDYERWILELSPSQRLTLAPVPPQIAVTQLP